MKKICILLCIICCLSLQRCNASDVEVIYDFNKSSMDEVKRKNYITSVTKFLEEIDRYGINDETEKFWVCVDDETITKYQLGKIYINTDEIELLRTYFQMLLALTDGNCNVGEAYVLATQIYHECGIGIIGEKYTDEELAEFFSDADNLYLLDFTLPMFETYYFDEDTAKYVQAAAVAFVRYCIEEYGMQKTYNICMDTSEEGRVLLVEVKNDWLADIGATLVYEEYGKIPFFYNYERENEDYPYVVKAETSNWYFSSVDIRNMGYCMFIDEYKRVAPIAELDFADARGVLKDYLSEEMPAVDIFTQFYKEGNGKSLAGYYDEMTDAIWLCTDWEAVKSSLLHEYVHYLTIGKNKVFKRPGLYEGLTEAIAVFECENRLWSMRWKELSEYDYAICKEKGVLDPDTGGINLEAYMYCCGTTFYEREGGDEYFSIMDGYITKPDYMTMGALSYEAAACVAKYLFELYGMDQTIKYTMDEFNLKKLTGKSFVEFYDEWGAWNEQRYEELKEEYNES